METKIDQWRDIIDVRDIIARIEELREARDEHENPDVESPNMGEWGDKFPDDASELAELEALMSELQGMGGDEQWEGEWYPLTLIRDSYFKEYAQELADDIGAIPRDVQWPMTCIDWDHAARELQHDYSGVYFRDVLYWTR